MSPRIILLLDKVFHISNENKNSIEKHESVILLFLPGGGLYKQKKLIFLEDSVIDSRITSNDWWAKENITVMGIRLVSVVVYHSDVTVS